jgi:hypothetical protein
VSGCRQGRFSPRTVDLPDGRALVIRPIAPTDLDGLAELYQTLSDHDRYLRFFSVFRPRHPFFERMVAVAERGGLGLVAAVTGPDPAAERLVGEAGFERLPNGNGELAIAVAAPWRGWLGPYLLDALIEAAASLGVPNLEADVLMTNGPMLAAARGRGCAAMPNPDRGIVRILIGTRPPSPTWPAAHDRPRVLVEGAGGRWHAEKASAAGLEVVACTGPTGRPTRCPALAGEPCPLAAGADIIVITHPPEGPDWNALIAAHPHLHPGVPVCLELPSRDGDNARAASGAPAAHTDVVALVQRLVQADAGRGADVAIP